MLNKFRKRSATQYSSSTSDLKTSTSSSSLSLLSNVSDDSKHGGSIAKSASARPSNSDMDRLLWSAEEKAKLNEANLNTSVKNSRIQNAVSMTDKNSERYYIHCLNTNPSVSVLNDLVECIRNKPQSWSNNFCNQYGLFSLNTYLVKNVMSVFNKNTSRLSLERKKSVSSREDDVYVVIFKCIECMKELAQRVDPNPFKDNLELVKSVGLLLGSSFFKKNQNAIDKPIMDCQLLVLKIFTDILQQGMLVLGCGCNSVKDITGLVHQLVLRGMDHVCTVYQESTRFSHLMISFRKCVITLKTISNSSNDTPMLEKFIIQFLNFVKALFDSNQARKQEVTRLSNVDATPVTEDDIHINLSQELINLGLLDTIKILQQHEFLSEEIKTAIKSVISSEAIEKEERDNLSKYDYLNQMMNRIYSKLQVHDSFSYMVNIMQILLAISNSLDKKKVQKSWEIVEQIVQTSAVLEKEHGETVGRMDDKYLAQQEQINTLQSIIRKLENQIEEMNQQPHQLTIPVIRIEEDNTELDELSTMDGTPRFSIPSKQDTLDDESSSSSNTTVSQVTTPNAKHNSTSTDNVTYSPKIPPPLPKRPVERSLSFHGKPPVPKLSISSMDTDANTIIRRLYFNQIQKDDIHRTTFNNIPKANLALNSKELLYLFSGRQVPVKARTHVFEFTDNSDSANVSFLNPKRMQYVQFHLGTIKMSTEEIKQGLISMDRNKLDDRTLRILENIAPKQEEVDVISTFDGDLNSLSPVDRFYYHLKDIPFLKERIQCWIFKNEYEAEFTDLISNIESCTKASKEMTSSQKWLSILSLILEVGNMLNKGAGDFNECKGFKINSLMKLKDVKSYNNKTLLEYISEFVQMKNKDLMTFDLDLIHVQLASQVRTIHIRDKIHGLHTALNSIQHQLFVHKYKPNPRDKFVSEFTTLKEQLSNDIDTVNGKMDLMMDQLENLALSYDEDVEMMKMRPYIFFNIINQFIKMFKNPQIIKTMDDDTESTEHDLSDEQLTSGMITDRSLAPNSARGPHSPVSPGPLITSRSDSGISKGKSMFLARAYQNLKEPKSARLVKNSKTMDLTAPISSMVSDSPTDTHSESSPSLSPHETGSIFRNRSKTLKAFTKLKEKKLGMAQLFKMDEADIEDEEDIVLGASSLTSNTANEANKTERSIERICRTYGISPEMITSKEDTTLIFGPTTLFISFNNEKIEYRAYLFNHLLFVGIKGNQTHPANSTVNINSRVQSNPIISEESSSTNDENKPPTYKIIQFDESTIRAVPNSAEYQNAFCIQNFKGDVGDIFIATDKYTKQIWIDKVKKVLEPPFFSDVWTKKINDNIQEHLSVTDDDPQSYYVTPMNELKTFNALPNTDEFIEFIGCTQEISFATLDKLLQYLTDPVEHDNNFLFTFMLTYKSFISSDDLLEYLIDRYNTPPPKDVEFQSWKKHLFAIRLRISQIVMYWVEKHFYNFRKDPNLHKRMKYFIYEVMAKTKMEKAAERILNTWEVRKAQRETFSVQQLQRQQLQIELMRKQIDHTLDQNNQSKTKKPSKLQKLISKFNMSSSSEAETTPEPLPIHPQHDNPLLETATEIARQLTMIDMEFFIRIQPKECLNQSWNKENQKKQAPNIYSMIERTNNLVTYVAFNILKHETPKDRAKVIHRFIKIANELRNIGNYNSLKGIIGGLNSNSIFRLKKTWALVSDNKKEQFKELVKLLSHEQNYKNLREAIKNQEPPLIPYIGVYLTDLTFIDEGNVDKKDEKINFFKQRHLATIIRMIQKLQKTPYSFPFHTVRNKLTNIYFCAAFDDGKLYDMSLEKEPRTQV